MEQNIKDILAENDVRNAQMFSTFNPITGDGSILERTELHIADYSLPVQHVPAAMMDVPLVRQVADAGSIRTFVEQLVVNGESVQCTDDTLRMVANQLTRIRWQHDFCFWAAMLVYIKPKGGGGDVLFRLNRPQRRLVTKLEKMRMAGKPIRLIILKARQWGGSTCVQLYFAWLQLVHKIGLNSLIIAQVKSTANKIQSMFSRMLALYPTECLYSIAAAYDPKETKWAGVGNTMDTHRIPQRNCTITVGSAEKPDSVRGDDYNLVHLSEVGLWKKTEGKTPEDIVRSACSGVMYAPYTMIVYESTANGVGNFFHREYIDAKEGRSNFDTIFVPWFEIELYRKTFANETEKTQFAQWLCDNQDNENAPDDRHETGRYLWWLWKQGASLEGINWYVIERAKFHDHGGMASEYPSDDIEAFVHSGANVFDKYLVEKLRKTCKPPRWIGEVSADGTDGAEALKNIRFSDDRQGTLWLWQKPEIDTEEKIANRYITIVDVGGRTRKADWSVVMVLDRLYMMDGGNPVVVAQWYGHTDIDLLAWKAAQIAAYYDNSLLVIESNTIETHDKERHIEGGDQSLFILNQIKEVYPNLYARTSADGDSIDEGNEVKYGFHTNTKTKPEIITMLIKVVREGLYVERDVRCCDEYDRYERRQNGSYGAILGAHDDLLMTRAIGLFICYKEMDMPFVTSRKNQYRSKKNKVQVTEAMI